MSSHRSSEINVSSEEFKRIGHQLIDKIGEFLNTIEARPVTPGETHSHLMEVLGDRGLPDRGTPAEEVLAQATRLLFDHSLLNGHPKFAGYITSSPAPIGALADLLAAIVNPNVGANILSPMATEIEKQTIQWLAEFIGLPSTYGGILVSGGNMANLTAFLAARTIKAPKNIKHDGISNSSMKLTVYCPTSTHTWIDKAAVSFGLGLNSVRWIKIDNSNKMDIQILEQTIKDDLENGYHPIMVIGTAGDVSTGAVDDLQGIARICKTFNLWFHVDGAYGAPAAMLPDFKDIFKGMEEADSIAIDPHKWLYSPLEAGCTLIRNPDHLLETFSSHPVYYNFSDQPHAHNYYEYGFQNSRGFRALKIWITLQHVGRLGYAQLIGTDIALSQLLFRLAHDHPELIEVSQNLSITTFQYVPADYIVDSNIKRDYLNKLNETLLNKLQASGEVFLSNALIDERYCLRSCIVNFRTSELDINEVVEIVVREGRAVHAELSPR